MPFFSVRVSSLPFYLFICRISFAFLVSFLFEIYSSLVGNNEKTEKANEVLKTCPCTQCSLCLQASCENTVQCPNLQTRVFMKTSPKRSYSVIENDRFVLVFAKTGSIISGTVYSYVHRALRNPPDKILRQNPRKPRAALVPYLNSRRRCDTKKVY